MTGILEGARGVQALAFVDACRIDRSQGVATDRVTGEDREDWAAVWAGPCRTPRADGATRVIVTGEIITPATPVVVVPWDVPEVRAGDRVTFTGSMSPGNVGRVLWVTDRSPRSFQSATHLTCREVR